MSPRFNLREVAKQCALLEDHLFHPAKRCPDCIRKHFLTIEAFLEEAVSLDKAGEMTEVLQEGARYIRSLQALWIDGRDMVEIARFLRLFRKRVTGGVFDFRVASSCPHKVAGKPAKAIYTGVFLDDPNQLINWWKQNVGPLHPKVKAHHMTIKFKPSEDEVKALSIGSPTSLKVVGYAQDDKGQAVLVKPQGIRSTNRHPHITVAVNGVSPAYSNDLLKKGATKVNGPTLSGRVGFFSNKQKDVFDVAGSIYDPESRVASRFLEASTHRKSIALMKFLSKAASRMGSDVGKHVYVVGGAVRNFVIDRPIKDIDVVIDAVSLGRGRDSEWFAKRLDQVIPAMTNVTTNQYGVAILTVKGSWVLDGEDLQGEVIEIANARKESYGGAGGKGYKPDQVEQATIQEDVSRREFTFNTLMWSLAELANGPDQAQILDLTGCGLRDLQEGVMKCPSNPDKTFSDDPTRMLRAIKFMVKYGFKIHPMVASSIKRNAKKLRNAPQNAIATLLIDTILGESSYQKALVEMKKLGLLDQVADMIREDKAFRSTMENWVSNKKVLFLFDLIDVGLPLRTRIKFLSPSQQTRLKQISLGLPEGEPEHLVNALRQPGIAIGDKSYLPGLARTRGLKGKAVGMFMRQVQDLARELLLKNPELAKSPPSFRRALEQEMRQKKLGSELADRVVRRATKSKTQVEDEEIQGLIRRLPKKKPPRNDLRKERVELDEDPDVETQGQEGDRDLSRNYKRVADAWLSKLDEQRRFLFAGQPAVAEDDADEGSQGSGKPSGLWVRFLKEYASEKRVKSPTTNNEVELATLANSDDPKAKKVVREEFEKWRDSLKDQDDSKSDKGSQDYASMSEEGLSKLWVTMDEKDPAYAEVTKHLDKHLDEKKKKELEREKAEAEAKEKAEAITPEERELKEKREEAERAEAAAKAKEQLEKHEREEAFDKKRDALLDKVPHLKELMGGSPDVSVLFDPSGAKEGTIDVSEATSKMVEHFAETLKVKQGKDSHAEHKELHGQLSEMLDHANRLNTEDGKTTPLQAHLKGALQAVAISAISQGGDHPDDRVKLDDHQKSFISNMASSKQGLELLGRPASHWHHKENVDLIHRAYLTMPHDQMVEALGGENSVAGGIAEAAMKTDKPELQNLIREIAINYNLDRSLIVPVVRQEQSSAEGSSGPSSGSGGGQAEPESIPTEATHDGPKDSCSGPDCAALIDDLTAAWNEGGRDAAEDVATQFRLDSFDDTVDSDMFPGPMTANVGAAQESGDVTDLHSKTDPPTKCPLSAA